MIGVILTNKYKECMIVKCTHSSSENVMFNAEDILFELNVDMKYMQKKNYVTEKSDGSFRATKENIYVYEESSELNYFLRKIFEDQRLINSIWGQI